jgi:O-antigen ligase
VSTMANINTNSHTHRLVALLLMIGLGGALISSSVLSAATLMLASVGIALLARKSLLKAGWEPPRELRLIHFAFWFFVFVSAYSWIVEGFDYEGGKTLGTHARFILFWPLIIALSHVQLRATAVFTAIGLISLSAIGVLAIELQTGAASPIDLQSSRFGGGINPISFGNIALLGGMLTLVSGLFFLRNKKRFLAMLFIAGSASAVLISLLSETRSNLLALPFLFLTVIPLLGRKLQLATILLIPILTLSAVFSSDRAPQSIDAALNQSGLDSGIELRLELWSHAWHMFAENPWTGAGLGGFSHAMRSAVESGTASPALLDCCVGHAHNDLLNNAATSGIPGVLSWTFLIFIPLVIFGQHLRSNHFPAAHVAAAGTMVTVGYFFFGLTEATFNRSLFLTFYLLIISALAATLIHELKASYVRKRRCRVSTTVITMNEEDHIADCLASARKVSDEIIVLDSGSSDRTVEIAQQYADIVETTDWPGFGVQKQRALERATGDWVLSLDADERITEELAREINHRLANPDADAYKLPWAVTIYGKRLDFGRSGRAPLRLFRREGVSFSDALVHERILIPEGRSIKTLRGRLTHYTHRDFGHSLEKSAKYAWLGSREKHRRGKRTRTMVYPTLRAIMTFIQVYFIRFGFLDGSVGYLTAVTYAQVTFNKYAGLWTLGRNKHPVE